MYENKSFQRERIPNMRPLFDSRYRRGVAALALICGRPMEKGRQAIIFLPCGFFILSSIYLLFSSPNLSGRRLDVYHTLTHGVALVRI